MGFSQGLKTVDLETILNSVRELDILSYYLGISNVPCIIKSPLRLDRHPSFGIYSRDGKKIYYHDFATKDRGSIFQLLMKLWNVNYNEMLQQIDKDLSKIPSCKNNISITKTTLNNSSKTYNKDTNLECKVRPWKNYDFEYWEQYGISEEWLKFGDIYPISHLILTKNGNRFSIPAEKYAYAYVERKDGNTSLKIYQPYNTNFKWSNKHDGSVWDLWTKLPEKGEHLIITSSRKDALCIWENTGIPAISLQAESYLPKQHVVQQLKDRFKYIYVLYDNDFQSDENHGRILGEMMANEFNLIQIEIPIKYRSKDTSDLCKNYGRQQVKEVIFQLIKEKNSITNENK